ncbi:MAG: CBS domain-containing protein, partial [Bacteroidetes bacterium]|nr:CBS domain-containing protein [Bacteroidota bacterium]
MNNPNLVFTIVCFLLAGYYGAVRAILLDSPFDWMRAVQDEELKAQQLAYWRRILRMTRLLLVALGCMTLVAGSAQARPELLTYPEWLRIVVLFLVSILAWLGGYLLWLRLGRAYSALVSVRSFPVRFAEWALTPVYWFLEPFFKEPPGLYTNRLPGYVREESESADDSDYEDHRIEERMFINALDFKDVRIRDCMIPRTEITAVALDDEIEDLRQAFISSGHSKIVVYRESIDDVVGYCHSLALFRKPKEISSIVTPMLIVPEAMPASDLMLRFLEERKSLALVVDEFGGTSGLVSVEDVVEQIFGEIQDEYDTTEDW